VGGEAGAEPNNWGSFFSGSAWAWDEATGRQIGWTPYHLGSLRSTGAWALEMADDGALWAGGDFNYSYTSLTSGQWSGGFVRMPARNATAPAVPAHLRAPGSQVVSVDGCGTYEESARRAFGDWEKWLSETQR